MATAHHLRTGLLRASTFAALLLSTSATALPAHAHVHHDGTAAPRSARPVGHARQITITYTTHDGRTRNAYVLLPHDYRPGQNPPIPLVISPHGRAVDGLINTRRYGDLPSIGRFAVVNPDGYGRKLPLHSWGAPEQIADLARMPEIVEAKLPWVHIDRTRLYAIGGSMGAQETLLLVARYPHLLAGAIAASCVPVQIWWSRTDATVLDPAQQSGRMYHALERQHPRAAVDEYVGSWKHTDAMRVETDMPKMLAGLGLLPDQYNIERLGAEHQGTVAEDRCTDR